MIIGPAFGFKEADLNQLSNSEYCVKCDLSGADLGGARLYGHNLSGADLREANLFRAYLGEANLSYADLSGASLDFAALESANLVGINLNGADLLSAFLYKTDLSKAILIGANLSRAILNEANMNGVDLSGANLRYGDLKTTNLSLAASSFSFVLSSRIFPANSPYPLSQSTQLAEPAVSSQILCPLNFVAGSLSEVQMCLVEILPFINLSTMVKPQSNSALPRNPTFSPKTVTSLVDLTEKK